VSEKEHLRQLLAQQPVALLAQHTVELHTVATAAALAARAQFLARIQALQLE
jgi:hypothetical protein